MSNDSNRDAAMSIRRLIRDHHAYRSECLNMCAAEGLISALTREMFATDLSRRYWAETGDYAGGKYIAAFEEICEDLTKRLFKTDLVNIIPVSGHIALLASVYALTEHEDRVMMIPDDAGGYTVPGFLDRGQIERHDFPFDYHSWNINVEETRRAISKIKPRLVVFGASTFPFPHPITEVIDACRDVGAAVLYDGSHVLGLIAGGQFQDPLREGVDLMTSGTNKSFPGPHKGLVIVREDSELRDHIQSILLPAPYFQSSHQVHHVAGLAVTIAEMLEFGQAYAAQIVANSQALAASLDRHGVAVVGKEQGFTQSHQVVLDTGGLASEEAIHICSVLEEAGIAADVVVRLGTATLTRQGMREPEMELIGEIIADLIHARLTPSQAKPKVQELARGFQQVHFTFEDDEAAFAYAEISRIADA